MKIPNTIKAPTEKHHCITNLLVLISFMVKRFCNLCIPAPPKIPTFAPRMPRTEVVIEEPGIGPVNYRRRRGLRRLSVRVTARRGVSVSVPYLVSLATARAFVHDKTDWILRAVRQVRQQPTVSEQDPAEVAARIAELRRWAKAEIPARLEALAAAHGFTYNGVTIKKTVSRWGSCSATNHINISLYLMLLPEHLRDFVLLHELVHTRYKNHGPAFHAKMQELCGGREKELSREIRKYAGLPATLG